MTPPAPGGSLPPGAPPPTATPPASPARPPVTRRSPEAAAAPPMLAHDPVGDFFHATWEIARKEALQHLRTKRLLILAGVLLVGLVFITIVVPIAFFDLDEVGDGGEFGDEGDALENFVFLFFLNAPVIGGLFLMQLLAVVLTADGVSSEWQRRTVFLVLSKPVPRSAFVIGKFLGAVVPLILLFTGLFLLDYLFLQGLLPGTPSGEDWGRFFGTVLLLDLGMMTFAALGLFFSTLTRSTLASTTYALAMVIVVFPLVGGIGDFMRIADDIQGEQTDADDFRYDWSHYFTPASPMLRASDVLVEEDIPVTFSFLFPQQTPQETWGAVLSGFAFTALFVGLSLLTVLRRDFE